MSDKPTLKYVACHRRDRHVAAQVGNFGERISKGPLKGCMRHVRSVFKIGRGYLLEFRVCIRVSMP